MINALVSASDAMWEEFAPHLRLAFSDFGMAVDLSRDHAPGVTDYIVYAPNPVLTDFTPFTRAKAVLSLWAGVERIVGNPTLTQPLCRMVDPGLTQGMVEYVCAHVLRHHLGLDVQITGLRGHWEQVAPPLASDRRVTVLGLGELGLTCARALAGLGFAVTGWSARVKDVPGITGFSGPDGLTAALSRADILVTLLPRTSETENLLNAARLALLPKGAVIINAGRGALIDDNALIAALDSGQIGHATLDVFRTEPLPPGHPFWHHPRITVTPHIAAATRPASAARVIAENIRRGEAGVAWLHLVDRARGY